MKITSPLFEAFLKCPTKCWLRAIGEPPSGNTYAEWIETQNESYLAREVERLLAMLPEEEVTLPPDMGNLKAAKWRLISSRTVRAQMDSCVLESCLHAVERVPSKGRGKPAQLIPIRFAFTNKIGKDDKLLLAFDAFVLAESLGREVSVGKIIHGEDSATRKVKTSALAAEVRKCFGKIATLLSSPAPPELVLNRHCTECEFQTRCRQKALEKDDLSLLSHMSEKERKKLHSKGIFTVTQLSYLFKPRRRRQRAVNIAVRFNIELQALALRTGKIYINEAPTIPERPVELFLDIEGIPDQECDYLIGLVSKENDTFTAHSFWADSTDNEKVIFQDFVELASVFGDVPIYHYGSYEPRAFSRVAKKYGIEIGAIESRLVNVNSYIFGKVYFPARSNSLKDLGSLIGAMWDTPCASGLQSLVWRQRWEITNNEDLKRKLINYNLSDCHALRLLVNELREIGKAAHSRANVDFADHPKKNSTDPGAEIHQDLQGILKSAHAEYRRHRIRVRRNDKRFKITGGKLGAPKGHTAYVRIAPTKVGRTVRVRRRAKCRQGHSLQATGEYSENTVIDLAFTSSGCRKTVTKYFGAKARCPRCHRDYVPSAIGRLTRRFFGHAFQAWAVYQRVALRLPFSAIVRTIEDLFSEEVTKATVINFITQLSDHYASTGKLLMERILASPFVHADETKVSIGGTENYVWVITNGTHVLFRLTETRETALIREILSGYSGVLVTDFYAGYDAFACRQQKCLVHLIRDLNDDLWKNPFNHELELFIAAVRDLLVPIFDDVEKYGLKARHLRKHKRVVDRFFKRIIDRHAYECEIVTKYQKRFVRYRNSLFVFLEEDGIPWNNNAAERAIRHLAVQRKISGSFHRRGAVAYLRLLGIAQTCRFQKKSFLHFLISGEKDVDRYREKKRPRSSSRQVVKSQQPQWG